MKRVRFDKDSKKRKISKRLDKLYKQDHIPVLPYDMLNEIFSYLGSDDLRTCACVCSSWNNHISNILKYDCVFICDITKSMSTHWKHLINTMNMCFNTYNKFRYGFIGYSEHSYTSQCIQRFDLTYNTEKLKDKIENLKLAEGNDYPEAVHDGLYTALNMNWNTKNKKICILVCDAPPHGIEYNNDASDDTDTSSIRYIDTYPNGCPCGLNIEFILRTFMYKHISLAILYTDLRVKTMVKIFEKIYPNIFSVYIKKNTFEIPVTHLLTNF